jgi:4-carboxymuconolactone decarboxylase
MEQPRSFTSAVLEFLLSSSRPPAEQGEKVRRSVLGNAHVERAIAAATDFNRDFQQLITTYAWGTIWTRPLLDTRTRRLLVLAMMASLGRWEEFRMHVAAGLEHELEACDLKEILLLVAIYAGVPAANTAFQIAGEELNERPEE